MKRIHLFEFEDQAWFPDWIRVLMTRYIAAMHRLFGTGDEVADLAARALQHAGARRIHDLCSGHGGPQRAVLAALRGRHGLSDVQITLSDLYPNPQVAASFNDEDDSGIRYRTEPVDAAAPGDLEPGLRSMICSLHHMRPEVAQSILSDAVRAEQPFLAYEISDNSSPSLLWWTAFPIGALLVLFVTLAVRPMTWRQGVFTYLIPVLPFFIGWDGAVSNARTYGLTDLKTLLAGVPSSGYRWETGTLGSGPAKRLYLLGLPDREQGLEAEDRGAPGVA
ncbi:hypothetical protein OAX78_00720 [Planctomycetota bacterium]|nr:hypothetical protein [Planctomycetota bacterium]